MLFTILTGIFFQLITLGESLAVFETRIDAFSNPENKTKTGGCCQASRLVSTNCPLSCQTYFDVCLDDLNLEEPNCMFGRNKSQIFHKSSFSYSNSNNLSFAMSMTISTSLSWPGIFGLRIQAIDNSTRTSASKGIIHSSAFVDIITPGYVWKTKNETGPVSSFQYKYRVLCASNYYGKNCTIYCKPRNDDHGHYGCNENGEKYCLDGWTGIASYCGTPICTKACQHGRCIGPNVCSCDSGWSGPSCSTCQTRRGCVNGTCITPGGCICNTGWGGNNCDKETDYCGMRSPCKNGGICINKGMGNFQCYCQPRFTGKTCETEITACISNPCLNEGTCQAVTGGYRCNCTSGYTGSRCENRIDLCASFLCQNNGTCNATGSSPSCQCAKGFVGYRCESVVLERTATSIAIGAVTLTMQIVSTNNISPSKSFVPSFTSLVSCSQYIKSTVKGVTLSTTSTTTATSKRSVQESTYVSPSPSYIVYSRSSVAIKKTTSSVADSPAVFSSSYSKAHDSAIHRKRTTTYVKERKPPTLYPCKTVVMSSAISRTIYSVNATSTTASMTSSIQLSPSVSRPLIESASLSKVWNATVKKTPFQGSSQRSLAIGISVSISFVIILTIAMIIMWTKFSKRRGQHKFRTSSTIIPAAVNNACRIIDAAALRKLPGNNNMGHYNIEQLDHSSNTSERSQAISSKDINIESHGLQVPANIDLKERYSSKCNSVINFGYLSEGTSGYDSENSSGTGSANFTNRPSKSPLSANDILVSRFSTSNGASGDLPNCIVYHEEYQEVEL